MSSFNSMTQFAVGTFVVTSVGFLAYKTWVNKATNASEITDPDARNVLSLGTVLIPLAFVIGILALAGLKMAKK